MKHMLVRSAELGSPSSSSSKIMVELDIVVSNGCVVTLSNTGCGHWRLFSMNKNWNVKSNQIKSNESNLTDALWVYNLSAFWSASDTFDIHRIGRLLFHWTDIASYNLDLDWLHSDRHELWCTLQFLACSQNFRKYIEFHLDCFPPRIVANRFDSLYFDSDFVCNDCDVFSAR